MSNRSQAAFLWFSVFLWTVMTGTLYVVAYLIFDAPVHIDPKGALWQLFCFLAFSAMAVKSTSEFGKTLRSALYFKKWGVPYGGS